MAPSNSADALRFRRPWYWLVVLAVAAIAASVLVVVNARLQIAQEQRGFEAAQEVRLQRVEFRVDDYFGEAISLASFGARTLADSRGNLPLSEELTLSILQSRRNPGVYGVGMFYAPDAFAPDLRLVSVYDHVGKAAFRPYDHVLPDGIDEVLFTLKTVPKGLDYTQFAWYRRAATHNSIVFAGPYTLEGRSFISTLRAARSHGRLVGVMSVDTLTPTFIALMASPLSPGDVAWIESSHGGGRLLGTAPIPAGARMERRIRLRYTQAFLHLSTDATALEDSKRDQISSAVGLLLGLWALTALFGVGLVQRWRAQEREHALQAERVRLETQVALAKTVEGELRKAAFTDSLTGLPNRAAFMEYTRGILAGNRDSHAVFFIDLDRFNIVNETLGHLAGDDLLRAIGERLQSLVESTDLVARLGGDEFVVIGAVESRSFGEAAALLLTHVSEPIIVEGRPIYPEASIGVVAVDASYTTPEELLRDADIAMYEAKHRGRAQFAIFDAPMRQRVADDSQLEDDLRRAIERGELVPYYQPIVSMTTRRIIAFEALVRWNRRDGSITVAADFMDFAEQHGFIQAIDTLVFRAVCAHAKAIFDLFPSALIAVNISASELPTAAIGETIEPLIRQHDLPANRLKLEITETAMMTSSEASRRTIERLREVGIEFILDDFGTGYSSLAYLQRLPIAGIKIDRSFVAPLLTDPKAIEIIRSIVMLARSFGLSTTAEGVESFEHFELLASLGVDHAQGFFFSPALEIGSLARLLDQPISSSSRAAVE
ncbi:MAG TPA: EAL domain-containing protein [Verrucomicrobiae bacterium]|nr:EAL domain-containing protein [Verrucomicrobiae bacterium]